MPSTADLFAADSAQALWDSEPLEGAFDLTLSDNTIKKAVATKVSRPWLFGYKPTSKSNNRAVLILGGGGYVELMIGREGVAVARWLASLGFEAYVLVHRFPNSETGPSAPVDDARQALRLIKEKSGVKALAVCGLSSGGHLASALLAEYPSAWSATAGSEVPELEFAVIGYGPISTNAKGHTIIPNKAPLPPAEKQELYDVVIPDQQLRKPAPPSFVVYSGNDPVVPVVNAYRISQAIQGAGGEVELHVFADAPHGFGLDTEGLPVSKWPQLCEAWLRQKGFLG
ncbi:Acetylxylan esterase [Colletotrichum orbiculare MAFF 240422]|uniref:Acetylxylan esterase n=1 Tax=Colletotrichum orbiculare (strain 104-T / ATCC 96160 / CBS 514.97 / LARS 414 / MAFF 240422) TaxID=1213857 RepID=N4V5E9_COLOR|nr:Acetylxylan esterase [Colletotrichum orbiculare MAFF 240422]